MLTELLTTLAIRVIRFVNRHKDESLSYRLHRLADRYARRPTGRESNGQVLPLRLDVRDVGR